MSPDISTRQGCEAFIRLSDAVGLADAAKIVADLRAELARRDAVVSEGQAVADLPYQVLFNAIAAAVDSGGGSIEISVSAFRQALPRPAAPAPEAPTKIELQDQIREAISTAQDLVANPPPHGASRRHTEANRTLDRMVDRLYAGSAVERVLTRESGEGAGS